jgi:hypothetical protein
MNQERVNYLKDKEAYIIEREYDLAYLKFTIILVLLIIIIFYITCKFNIKQSAAKTTGPVKVTQLGVKAGEHYTPSPSILKNDIFRSDPAFDMTNGYEKTGYMGS